MSKFVKIILYWSVLLGLGIASIFAITSYFVFKDMPSIESLQNYKPPQSTQVFDRNGHLIGRFYDEKRTLIDINKLPAYVPLAFIAAEDADFFEHKGIDINGLFRAIVLEIKYRLIGGRRVGGSTITQQAARTMLLSSNKSYVRKLKEMILAIKIEKSLSKEQILSIYLNQIYFGNGAYGIEEASKTYFSKPAKKLEIFEAAFLASIPKSPNNINPFGNIVRLKERQRYVLAQMQKNGIITEEEKEKAEAMPMFSSAGHENFNEQSSQYFLRSIKNQLLPTIDDEVLRRGGIKVFSTLDLSMQKLAEQSLRNGLEALDKKMGYRGPLFRASDAEQKKLFLEKVEEFRKKVFTSSKDKIWSLCGVKGNDLDSSIEHTKILEPKSGLNVCAIISYVNDKSSSITADLGTKKIILNESQLNWAFSPKKNKVSSIFKEGDIILIRLFKDSDALHANLEQKPEINGGFVTLDVKTGDVLAMVGGYDFEDSQYNRITQAKRQIGSTIKPFIYALAIDKDLVTPASIITDAPKAYLNPSTNEVWKPKNHYNKFLGDVTLRKCLTMSINICTLEILQKVGIGEFLSFAKAIELSGEKTPFPRNLTIGLGSAESYPINVANAFRIFPNLGEYSPYRMLTKVKFADGKIEKFKKGEKKEVIGPEASFITTWILKDVISKKRKEKFLNQVKCDAAGKTGTNNGPTTTWYYGFTPNYVSLVYVGFDDNRIIGKDAWGINTAFPIWSDFNNKLLQNQTEDKFTVPEGLASRYINQKSGKVEKSLEESNEENLIVLDYFKAYNAPELSDDEADNYALPLDLLQNSAFAP